MSQIRQIARHSQMIVAVFALSCSPLVQAQTFTDGFEAPTLNPYWTVIGPGTATLTTAAAHGGSQSVLLAETPYVYAYSVALQHAYDRLVSGTVSVWMLDNVFLGNGADLEIGDDNGNAVGLQRVAGGFVARIIVSGVEGPGCTIDTASGWHKLEIATGLGGVTPKIDGVALCTNAAITGFRYLSINVWGNPGTGSEYFDDFNANVASPYSVCLLYDPTKAVKSGATIPIKLQLCDVSGANQSSSSIVVHAINITQTSTLITGPVEDAGNANPDDNFRYDPTLGGGGGYIFNLSTNGLSTGTYGVNFIAGSDPTVHQAPFQVK